MIRNGANGGTTSRLMFSGVAERGGEFHNGRFRLQLELDLFKTYIGFLLASASQTVKSMIHADRDMWGYVLFS
jgi:hypothetical protein